MHYKLTVILAAVFVLGCHTTQKARDGKYDNSDVTKISKDALPDVDIDQTIKARSVRIPSPKFEGHPFLANGPQFGLLPEFVAQKICSLVRRDLKVLNFKVQTAQAPYTSVGDQVAVYNSTIVLTATVEAGIRKGGDKRNGDPANTPSEPNQPIDIFSEITCAVKPL